MDPQKKGVIEVLEFARIGPQTVTPERERESYSDPLRGASLSVKRLRALSALSRFQIPFVIWFGVQKGESEPESSWDANKWQQKAGRAVGLMGGVGTTLRSEEDS